MWAGCLAGLSYSCTLHSMATNRDYSALWDTFIDYCVEHGLDYTVEDYHGWVDDYLS